MKVLIAIDGSEFGLAAVETYAKQVSSDGDEVKVVTVVEPLDHIVGAPFGVVEDYYSEYINNARAKAASSLEEAESRLSSSDTHSITVSCEVLTGPPARSIVEAAAEWHSDLIVVGSHGRGFWGRMYIGSVSSSVVHHAPCSVLVAKK